MRYKKYVRKIAFLMGMMMVLQAVPVRAAEHVEQQTIKVGFFESAGYHIMDEEETMSGYGFDFLQMLLRYNNWNYEYIGYQNDWPDMLKMLDEGKIDMLTLANKTEERQKLYDYSSKSIGTSSTIMTARGDAAEFTSGDYASYDGVTVGLVQDSYHNEGFETFAKEHGFTYTPKYYKNVDETEKALQDREVDVAVTSNMHQLSNEVILEEFNAQEYYVIVKKGNEALLEQINRGIDQLDIYSPDWRNNLYQKYYAGLNETVISLSAEERKYLEEMKKDGTVIRAVMNPELKPYSYFEDGEAKGIAPAVFQEIADRLGLKYEILEAKNRMEYKKLLNSGEADVDLTAYMDYSLADKYQLKETDAYMTTTLAMVSRKDRKLSEEDMVVAALKDPTEYIGYNQKLIYSHKYKEYDSVQECIDAVKHGKADVTYSYAYIAEQAVSEDYRNKLRTTILPDYNLGLCIGVEKERDHRLLSILNKAVNSLNSSNVQSMVLEETTGQERNRTSLLAVAYDRPYVAIGFVALLFVALFALIMMQVYRRNQEKERQQAANLADALAAAQNANNAKGVFVSRVSHEIRTPLNAVIGYMAMAKDAGKDPEKMLHCIDNSEIAAKQLLGIINDVLDISALENGKMKIASEDFDLKALISNLTTIFYGQARKKGVQFEVFVEDLTEEWVVGDQLRVNQVLMNLLSNAVKFTSHEGKVTLLVKQLRSEEGEVSIRFEISDTGIGMSEEYRERLFTPFEQESAKTAQKYGGTGLGLSIVNNLVHMMHGAIDVKSVQGEGTTFTVLLSFAHSEQNQRKKMSGLSFSSLRVLIVDDEKDAASYVRTLLKRLGIKSDAVGSGEQAMKRIRSRKGTDYAYNLCIMDWNMPGMNGIDTARKIRKECDSSFPIIIATAYDTSAFEDHAIEAGVDKVIAKPLFQSTLFDLLVNLYGKYEVEEPKRKEKVSFKGMHILLAEDNAMNMEIAVNILEKAGIVVNQAWNGKEACDKFLQSEPGTYHVILMDIQMPEMDGYAATRKIRASAHPEAKTISIIAMTANAFAEDVSAALAAGMDGHISKPINYDKLFQVLEKEQEK